jgi:molybdate transport system substrate-binding protein
MKLSILSGGAAQGLVEAVAPRFKAETGREIAGTFGAVGAMRDRLLAGTPADLLILTRALIAELERRGRVQTGSVVDIGMVRTGIAVRSGDPVPAIATAPDLKAALLACDAVYFPNPLLATAGIHFTKVIDTLGIRAELELRLRPFANGATAMRALAKSSDLRPIGCTQVTEILNTPGAALAGLLPREFELATVYTAAVATGALLPDDAAHLATLMAGASARADRERLGFDSLA